MNRFVTMDAFLKQRVPDLALGVVRAHVTVAENDAAVKRELEAVALELEHTQTEQISAMPKVDGARRAYRALGKDPSRYRSSAEALLRRVASGKGLYYVNSVVDVNNVVSLKTMLPVGSYDVGRLEFPVVCRVGKPGETYAGIGKGMIDVEALPLLADVHGAFGSPTSDSDRAKIVLGTEELMMVVFSFAGRAEADSAVRLAAELLQRHCHASDVEWSLVE